MSKKKISLAMRLRLAEARADDAMKQFNEAKLAITFLGVACELNMQAYESAQAKIEELTDMYAKEFLKRVNFQADLQMADNSLKEYKGEVHRLKVEAEQWEVLFKHAAAMRDEFAAEIERQEDDLRVQRELLINYNTRGNLINWFGEFLLSKSPARTTQ